VARGLRVVHYLNQFFGGIGGEEKASEAPQVKDGLVGPGRLVQDILKEKGKVVATVICGDNYFAERVDEVAQEVTDLIAPYQPDIVLAGPAFNAGRYGVACGATCKAVQDKLGIPAVTGMYEENPGVDLYKKDIYIIKTADSARGMAEAIPQMVNLALKLAKKQEIGKPDAEGYIPRGILRVEFSNKTAAQRALDMLLAKLQGKPFETELHLPDFERVAPAAALKHISVSKIALVTDGGLVPRGNPDKLEPIKATKYGVYDIKDVDKLVAEDYEVSHVGYNTSAVSRDPHRLVPLDVMRDLEKEGIIGNLYGSFYATAGVAVPVENAKRIGQGIAEQLKAGGVDGVILTST